MSPSAEATAGQGAVYPEQPDSVVAMQNGLTLDEFVHGWDGTARAIREAPRHQDADSGEWTRADGTALLIEMSEDYPDLHDQKILDEGWAIDSDGGHRHGDVFATTAKAISIDGIAAAWNHPELATTYSRALALKKK